MNKKSVVITGAFDILHKGHFELFKFAENFADKSNINILLEGDKRIKHLKGDTRPINDIHDRIYAIKQLGYICNSSYSFDSDDNLYNILSGCFDKPIRIIGMEYRDKPIIGESYCSSVIFFNTIHGYSTTNIIQKIKS